VYMGAERDGWTTPSFWGSYDRLICVAGLSKAYGLPGLRIGWLVAPAEIVADAWARHDYTTIGPSGVSDHLATLALQPAVRERLLGRTRGILRENYPVLEQWLKAFGPAFAWVPPQAGAICFVRYHSRMDGAALVERVRAGQSVLLVPGEHFGMPGFLRFGFGNETAELRAALAATADGLRPALGD